MSDIDFDEASAAWRANKKSLGGGMFAYRCAYIHTSGKRCNKTVEASKKPKIYDECTCRTMSRLPETFCWQHRNVHVKFHTNK